jgi:hypothetical protein
MAGHLKIPASIGWHWSMLKRSSTCSNFFIPGGGGDDEQPPTASIPSAANTLAARVIRCAMARPLTTGSFGFNNEAAPFDLNLVATRMVARIREYNLNAFSPRVQRLSLSAPEFSEKILFSIRLRKQRGPDGAGMSATR